MIAESIRCGFDIYQYISTFIIGKCEVIMQFRHCIRERGKDNVDNNREKYTMILLSPEASD